MADFNRWSDRNAHPNCLLIILAGIASLLTALWPVIDALT